MRRLFTLFLLVALPLWGSPEGQNESPGRHLIAAGGGNVSDEMRLRLLTLSPVEEPSVLIIPHAARERNFTDRAEQNTEAFRQLGVGRVEVLDLDDPDEALRAIERAGAVWMPGGFQSRLMRALDEAGVADALRARFAAGVPMGGTSAGAAIVSETMLAGSRRNDIGAPIPIISHGLGFWPGAIVDQHFSERNRLARLKAALELHPGHAGIGIDEDTAVVFDGRKIRVMGENTVTVLRLVSHGDSGPVFDKKILNTGDVFTLEDSGESLEEIEVLVREGASVPEIVETLTPRLMIAHNVPGVSVAVIRSGELAWLGHYGLKTHGRADPVDAETVFEAASMSKPAYAYVVLQLVQEGIIDLDTPLVEYYGGPYMEDEPMHKKITARMVLSHTSGFPNWRPGGWRNGGPLPIHFEPGTDMRYSGEGFLFLQRAIERFTGIPTDDLIRERLLEPLKMHSSSYAWKDAYDSSASAGHTSAGEIPERARSIYRAPNTAFTLYTTPADYARFLIEMMRPDRSGKYSLKEETLKEMLTIHSDREGSRPMVRRGGSSDGSVHFGLGWRIEKIDTGYRYCHSGSNGTGFRCYSEFNPSTGNGIVIMTNGVGGRELREELMRYAGEE